VTDRDDGATNANGFDDVCPECDEIVQPKETRCVGCGEYLGAPGEYAREGGDSDRQVLADTEDGDSLDEVYREYDNEKRKEEFVLLAWVLGGAAVLVFIIGLALGWWSDDDARPASNDPAVVEPVAVDPNG